MLKRTSRLLQEAGFTGPAILILEEVALRNIRHMVAKARQADTRFRPHFKTHQSADVGRWFADEGVEAITVSNLDMAEHFAAHGWDDITLAFLLNPRQWPRLETLARDLAGRGGRLGVTIDAVGVAQQIAARPDLPLDVWLKTDVGYGRSGTPHTDTAHLARVFTALQPHAGLRGLLTHAGHSYAATSDQVRERIWKQSLQGLTTARAWLDLDLELSLGDTPCCWSVPDLRGADEVRPGNFVFFDLMQHEKGVCGTGDLAAAAVCPVVGLYPDRGRVVLHGGAVHLSRESLPGPDGTPRFGRVGSLDPEACVHPEAALTSLSQEHGILDVDDDTYGRLFGDLEIGDLLLVWPVHSCLACDLHTHFRTLGGDLLLK